MNREELEQRAEEYALRKYRETYGDDQWESIKNSSISRSLMRSRTKYLADFFEAELQRRVDEVASQKKSIVRRIGKESTAPDKDCPTWLEMDIDRGFEAALELIQQ